MHITMEGVGIIIFTIIMIGIGYYYSKKNSGSSDDFFLSGRGNGMWPIVAGHVMGWVGAGTLVGVYGTAYSSGISSAIWYPIGFTVSFFLFGLIMARRLKRLGDARHVTTLTEVIRRRFNNSVGSACYVFEFVQCTAYVVGQYMSIAIILNLALGISYAPSCILAGVVVLVYVALGGLTGSLVVTLMQMGVCIVGLILAVVVGANHLGGLSNVMASLPEGWDPNIFSGQTVLGVLKGFLPTFLASFIYSSMYLRSFSAKDEKTASKACMVSGLIATLIVCLTILGVYISVVAVPGLESGDYVLIMMFREILPWGAAIFAAAIVAACMSTASEQVITISAAITNDFAKGVLKIQMDDARTVLFGRVVMVAITVICCVIAIFMSSVLSLMYYASNVIATFVPSYLIGLWWNRVNWQGMMAAVIGGGSVAVFWDFIPGASAIMGSLYAGIIVSITLLLIVTLATPAPDKEKIHFIQPFQSAKFDPDTPAGAKTADN